MSLLLQTRRESYRAQRQASHGAGVTLVSGCGEWVATFDCAQRVAEVLGSRGLQLSEEIPSFKIPVEEINDALAKLSECYSVALIDLVCDRVSARFVLVWKILANVKAVVEPISLDEY